MPLLIGGATTSRQHTAVKIAPDYSQAVVHVLDASRSVNVVSDLLSAERRGELDRRESRRAGEAPRGRTPAARRSPCSRSRTRAPTRIGSRSRRARSRRRRFLGRRVVDDVRVEDLVPYIDWTFFFSAWDLKGRYPKILDDPKQGAAARDLYDNGRRLLDEIIAKRWLTPRAVYGFWPARSEGDDIVLYAGEDLAKEIVRFPMLRQQAVAARREAEPRPVGFHRPGRRRGRRSPRRLRRHERQPRRTRSPSASRRTTTTTARSW